MIRRTRHSLGTAFRILLFTGLLVGPVGAFAMNYGNTGGDVTGAGLVLFVSLQRAG